MSNILFWFLINVYHSGSMQYTHPPLSCFNYTLLPLDLGLESP